MLWWIERHSKGVCSVTKEVTITQVTGVQDVKTKCDKSYNRVEEEINSSWDIWESFRAQCI